MVLQEINQALQRGDVNRVTKGSRAHWSGLNPGRSSTSLLAAMEVIGIKFKNNESSSRKSSSPPGL